MLILVTMTKVLIEQSDVSRIKYKLMFNYKLIFYILTSIILIAVLPQDISAQSKTDSLKQYVVELQKNPDHNTIREKIIALALSMNPAPVIPEDLERYRDTPWFVIAPALKEGRVVYAA